jgi:hypothetical protein
MTRRVVALTRFVLGRPAAAPPERRPPRYRFVVLLYDALYRVLHGLHRPESEVGPALRIELRRSRRRRRLPDGTAVGRGARIGVLHLNNARIAALHDHGAPSPTIGLELRRLVLASLEALALLASPGGPLADVAAFRATTIFHRGLQRLGFRGTAHGLVWPRLVGIYQRAFLASLHPAGAARLRQGADRRARCLWMSRAELIARYGRVAPAGTVSAAPRGGCARWPDPPSFRPGPSGGANPGQIEILPRSRIRRAS